MKAEALAKLAWCYQQTKKFDRATEALSALMLAFAIELFAILGWAALSDRIGRRPVYMFGALAGVALSFPFFWMVGTKEWIWIALAFILARAVVTAAPRR